MEQLGLFESVEMPFSSAKVNRPFAGFGHVLGYRLAMPC